MVLDMFSLHLSIQNVLPVYRIRIRIKKKQKNKKQTKKQNKKTSKQTKQKKKKHQQQSKQTNKNKPWIQNVSLRMISLSVVGMSSSP